jgi:hypothetical protein
VTYTLTATVAALDGTNLTISFTAPASGRVVVEAEVFVRNTLPAARGVQAWAVLGFVTHATTTVVAALKRFVDWDLAMAQTAYSQAGQGPPSGAEKADSCHYVALVTGLTPNQAYQWDLAGAYSTTGAAPTVVAYADNGAAASGVGPATLVAWAA